MKKGDKVVTIGGIHGTVVTVKEQTVVLKVDDNARLEFTKSAISTVLNKEGAKSNPAKKADKAVKDEPKVDAKSAEQAEPADNTVEFKAPEKQDK